MRSTKKGALFYKKIGGIHQKRRISKDEKRCCKNNCTKIRTVKAGKIPQIKQCSLRLISVGRFIYTKNNVKDAAGTLRSC